MRQRDPTAIAPPWLLVRERIAAQWGIPPYAVDDPDLADEVGRWVELRNLEHDYG